MTKHEIQLSRARGRTKQMNMLGLSSRGTPLQIHRPRNLKTHGNARKIEYQRLFRNRLKDQGLTVRGTERKNRQWPDLRGLTPRAQDRARSKVYRAENRRRGLNGRGRPLALFRSTPRERAWREFRAAMNIRLPELFGSLERAE